MLCTVVIVTFQIISKKSKQQQKLWRLWINYRSMIIWELFKMESSVIAQFTLYI
jgi:hypothetical protein